MTHQTLSRRSLIRAAALAGGGFPVLGSAQAARRRPNVILIMADDQGFEDLSSHGNADLKTPHLDRLRSEAVRLTDFHVSPMCAPTRASLLTGYDALATGAMNVSAGRSLLRRDLPTLAEAFAANGYRTGLFGKWHLGDTYPYRPEDRGFQETVWFPSSHIGSVPDAWNNDYFNDQYRNNGRLRPYEGYCTDVFFGEATRWIRERSRASEPFFVYLALNAPHMPLFAPPEYVAPYRHLPDNLARYYGMLSNIDANVGALEKVLREIGLYDNTIVIYLSDNGGAPGTMRTNAGMRGSKPLMSVTDRSAALMEGGHRVPCMIRWPAGGISGGRDCGELAQAQDVFPTLMDLCGLKTPAGRTFHGTSLASLLRGRVRALADRILVVQFSRMSHPRPEKNDAAVMWRKWRMVGGNELYDLGADPRQAANLFSKRPEVAARLQRHYDRWWTGVEPRLDDFLPVHVGSDRENPTLVSSCEWADVWMDMSAQVRRGELKNGMWRLHIEKEGDYEISLRRWPRDADATIASGVPAHEVEHGVGVYPAGVALPIRHARLNVGAFDRTLPVAATDKEAVFRMPLTAGRTTMQSWFSDAGGQPLLGAYYAYVERKG